MEITNPSVPGEEDARARSLTKSPESPKGEAKCWSLFHSVKEPWVTSEQIRKSDQNQALLRENPQQCGESWAH